MTAHKVNQAASDRSAMKDFMKDLEEDDDEEEMQEWIREQKESRVYLGSRGVDGEERARVCAL